MKESFLTVRALVRPLRLVLSFVVLSLGAVVHAAIPQAPALAAPANSPASQPTSSPSSQAKPVPTAAELMEQARKLQQFNIKMFGLFKAGKYAEVRDIIQKKLQEEPDDYIMWYNLACAQGRLGEKNSAFASLEKAMECGYADFVHMEQDDDLKTLRAQPEYAKLLARKNEFQKKRAERILQSLKKQFGEDYICEVDDTAKLIVATNVDRDTLNNTKLRLTRQAQALWNDLFDHKFEQYVTVVISRTESSQISGVGGYYNPATRSLVSKTVGSILTHEFTHALHAADIEAIAQSHPIWVTEGLATLFEASEVKDGHIKPLPNERLLALKRFVDRKQNVPLAEFFKYDQPQYLRKAAICYSQGRYVMMYLYDTGKLRDWYREYTKTFKQDPTGVAAMEKVFDKKLPAIEADWLAWVEKQKDPTIMLPPNHAYLGIRVEPETDGVQVMGLVTGSGAENAGLKIGDLIYKIDGRDILEPLDLISLVDGHKVGDKVSVLYKRGGKNLSATVTLLAMPAQQTPRPLPKLSPTPTAAPTAAPKANAPAPAKQAA